MLNDFFHTPLGLVTIFCSALGLTFLLNLIVKHLYENAPLALLSFPEKSKKISHLRTFLLFTGFAFSFVLLGNATSYMLFFRGLIASFFLFIIIVTDFEQQVIFDRVLLPFALSALPFILMSTDKLDFIVASVGGGLIFLFIAIVSRGGLGGGDIKLIFTLGLWLGKDNLIFVSVCGFLLGGIVALFFLLLKKKTSKDYIAYGPYFALPAFLLLLTIN